MGVEQPFAAVLQAAQAGAEWAFAELYDMFNPGLLRYFGARAPWSAEDLASDTWMGVARGVSTFEGNDSGFRAWLYTIAHHRLADFWAESKRRPTEVSDPEAMVGLRAAEEPDTWVLDAMSGQEAARRIAEALPVEQAEIVLLRVVAGLDVEEVARVVGRRPATVRVIQHRALKKLSQEFSLDVVTE